jgi:uncharacterized protein YyaL (SSP411 family)
MTENPKHTNSLIDSTSPYLLQHAHNPVDWYQWSKEALDEAKKRDVPILLSIGYSACHWCHVMEKESFEDEKIAEIMNTNFVNIKVDREERPDLDEVYMAATQVMNKGQGGWPMTVFLAPNLKPFFAGTYFPPQDVYGRPGFPTILTRLAEIWSSNKEQLLSQADSLVQHLNSTVIQNTNVESNVNQKAVEYWNSNFDKVWGGFGPAPKFPNTGAILHLLNDYHINGSKESLNSAVKTLDSMHQGGIFDHIGGGFARYSVDEKWLVPHFEKMLYDNGPLMEAYLVGYQITKKPEYLDVISQIFEWLNDEMIDQDGGFYSSMDADSEGIEGKYYVWKQSEIGEILTKEDADIFNQYFDITEEGNWEGNSIPRIIMKKLSLSKFLKISENEMVESLERSRLKVKEHRNSRIPPGTDDKIIVSWNALMISSLAKVSYALGKKEYFDAADKAVTFIVERMSRNDGSLNRVYRKNVAHIDAFAEDYSYFGNSLIDMYEASFNPKYLELAKKYADILINQFYTEGQFKQSLSKNIVINSGNSMDNATPSYNFMCSLLLVRLHYYYDSKKYREVVEASMNRAGTYINQYPYAHSTALSVHHYLAKGPLEIALVSEEIESEFTDILRNYFFPFKIMASSASGLDIPLMQGKKMLDEKPTAYICKNYTCKEPITNGNNLKIALASLK